MGGKRRRKTLPSAGERTIKDVWLVQPPIGGGPDDVTPPLGLLALGAIIEAEGCSPHVVDLNLMAKTGAIDCRKPLRTQFVRALPKRSSQIDLIGITTWSYNFAITMDFVEAVRRKHPAAPVVLGGPHVTFVDEEVLRTFEAVDFVVRDEGDWTFPRLIHALAKGGRPEDLKAIAGLTWRRNGETVRNPSGPVVEDLDGLPYPAYHLIDVREYVAQQPTLVIEAGRGCPYNCNFCSTTNMFQRSYRVKSPNRLVDEVEWAMGQTGSNRFELLHDNLVANKKYVRSLCREIRERNLDVDWSCTSRPDNLTEDLAEEMFLAGCNSIFFGVETLDEGRQQWTGKKLRPPLVHAAIELTRRQHITPSLGIIIGFPDETESELDTTVSAALHWTTDPAIRAQVSTAVLRYYPGADLFAQADALGFQELAAQDSAAVPGHSIRDEWRDLTRLFPLQAIHTPPDETRRNLVRRNFLRTLFKVCPHTFRGLLDRMGHTPSGLLDQLARGRSFGFFEDQRPVVMWNEVVRALADLVVAADSPPLRELLSCEVPFWETVPVAEPLDRLEHVVAPKRYDQEGLIAWAHGKGPDSPPEVEGLSILAIRAGPEAVVWFTPQPQALLETFQRSFAEDRRGTLEYVNSLRRGL